MRTLLLLIALFSNPVFAFESGPGNGTDYRKILFSEAKAKLVQMMESENLDAVENSNLSSEFKFWLLSGENPKWPKLLYHLKTLELVYQEAPCVDDQNRTSSICFLYQNGKKYVLVSLSENTKTTSEQAMSMLIHEAGHFAGEMDHLFLNDLGVALVQYLQTPKTFKVVIEQVEMVAAPFLAKQDCEAGKSNLAVRLISIAKEELVFECRKNYSTESCASRSFNYTLRGEAEYLDGRGFTQNVICKIEAYLK